MFAAHVLDLDDALIVQCRGRLVRSEAAYRLRRVVQASTNARAIILDFSELDAVEGGGLGMLEYLQQWSAERGISFKILNPLPRVEERLKQLQSDANCEFACERQGSILSVVGLPERKHWIASSEAA